MGAYAVPPEIRALKPKGTMVKVLSGRYYVYAYRSVRRDGKRATEMGPCVGRITAEEGFVPNEKWPNAAVAWREQSIARERAEQEQENEPLLGTGLPPAYRQSFAVAMEHYEVSEEDFFAQSRTRTPALARHVATWLVRRITGDTFYDIGDALGKRSYVTTRAGYLDICKRRKMDPDFAAESDELLRRVNVRMHGEQGTGTIKAAPYTWSTASIACEAARLQLALALGELGVTSAGETVDRLFDDFLMVSGVERADAHKGDAELIASLAERLGKGGLGLTWEEALAATDACEHIADMLEEAGFACARVVESDPQRGKKQQGE